MEIVPHSTLSLHIVELRDNAIGQLNISKQKSSSVLTALMYTVEVDMKNIPETSQPPFVANMGWKEEIREERGR